MVATTVSTPKKTIRIADWLYWQWRYEQALAKTAQGKGA
jgi:hypothetical protein